MSYYDSELPDPKPKSGRSYTGPCPTCRTRVKGVSVNKDGEIKCPECDGTSRVSKKL